MPPRYSEVEVRLASAHPVALIGATRQALRRAGVAKSEIDEFSAQAFAGDDAQSVCRQWVRLVVGAPGDSAPEPGEARGSPGFSGPRRERQQNEKG